MNRMANTIPQKALDALSAPAQTVDDYMRDWLAARLAEEPDFEITTQPILSLFSFRHLGNGKQADLDAWNLRLVNKINDAGEIYLTQTTHDGKIVIRFVAGGFDAGAEDVAAAFDVITETARKL